MSKSIKKLQLTKATFATLSIVGSRLDF